MQKRYEPHSHSIYSNIRIIDCINSPEALVDKAIELGLGGIAITDHESVSSFVRLNKYQKKIGNDFKIVLGNEIYLTDKRENGIKYYHLILNAKDAEGVRQLRILSSNAWLNSYADRGERVPTLKKELKDIIELNKGHLICTSACLGGELSSAVVEMERARKVGDQDSAVAAYKQICNFIDYMLDLFGEDFYIEIAPGASKEQIIANKKLIQIAELYKIKVVIGCDAHYLNKEDRFVHKSFLNSKDGEREVDMFYEYAYLQPENDIIENLKASFGEFAEDYYKVFCANSMEICDKCKIYDLSHSQQIPDVEVENYPKATFGKDFVINDYPVLSDMYNSDNKIERYWVNTCCGKLSQLDEYNETYLSRLEEEARVKRVIGEKLDTNMFKYPVTLQHYVDMFWKCGSTVGAGRGSSCSGLNHYLLGITQLDPIKWELPFWRYLNDERVELGDIDLDLSPSRRPLIINEIKNERGRNIKIKDIPSYMEDLFKKELGCTLVATFGTESTKSAILTACRGYRSEELPMGIDNDVAQYLSSLIPQERGFLWSLKETVYGNEEKDRKPVQTFVNEVSQYPGLLDIMFGVEGIISRRGSHASGVILFDEDPFRFGSFMKTPSGDVITAWDLHDSEWLGMVKYDFLVTEIQDKITECIKLLQEDGELPKDKTLREIYEEYLHPELLPIEDNKIWKAISNVEVLNLFQFDSDVGSQAAKKICPHSIMELTDANGLMRLMTAEKGEETPMEKYCRYKKDIGLWYDEMQREGLTKEEMKIVEPYFLKSYGVPPSQEQLMQMLMDPDICNFTLAEANAARKIVGKKQMSKIPELQKKVLYQAASPALGKYVWKYGAGPQMGYAFSVIHALAYSFIAVQTAYLATNWNPIYWNCACLIVNSGSLEDNGTEELVPIGLPEDTLNYEYEDLPDRSSKKKKEKSSDYAKIAKAIGDITSKGIELSLININTSDYGYKPDIKNNRILYGMKALSNINSEMIEQIKAGRPFRGIKDFMTRCPIKKTAMINLIKAGAFDEIETQLLSRKEIMAYYLYNVCDAKKRLTMQNFNGLVQHDLVPKEYELYVRIFNFNKYLKTKKNKDYYIFDDDCVQFFDRFMQDYNDSLEIINGITCIKCGTWDSIYKINMSYIKEEWLVPNKDNVLKEYNSMLFKETWDKYAAGSTSAWEMSSLCFYHGEHELKYIDLNKYGISNFFDLSAQPIAESYFRKGKVEIPIWKLTRIIGTCIAKNDNKSSISLLTTQGVVTVKFTRDYYAMFKKRISQIQPDGTKKVVEKGWFDRGNLLMIQGFRRDDMFVAKNYKSSEGHQLYKIDEVVGNDIIIRHDRFSDNGTIEEDY